jgi:DNA-binding response OmpR family regulator
MRKSILIIEDEADIREAMAESLKQEDYLVYTAEDGEVGLRLAIANKPDLILLDLVMPVMDGQTMLKKLRADVWGSSARVVIMSAMDDVDNVALAHETGINEYLIKSNTSLTELTKKVKEFIAIT